MQLLQLPPLHSLRIGAGAPATTFLHGSNPLSYLTKPSTALVSRPSPPSYMPPVRAMKPLLGRVICAVNDKTVNVVVTRLAPHPKYHRRMRIKKKYQAHDPENQFQKGDYVYLEKCRPISKTKSFRAIPVPPRDTTRKTPLKKTPRELGIPLESEQPEEA